MKQHVNSVMSFVLLCLVLFGVFQLFETPEALAAIREWALPKAAGGSGIWATMYTFPNIFGYFLTGVATLLIAFLFLAPRLLRHPRPSAHGSIATLLIAGAMTPGLVQLALAPHLHTWILHGGGLPLLI